MSGLVQDFISRMDQASNAQPSYGLKVTHLEMRDLGKRHLATYGDTHVEELIHYLDELALVIHKKAKFAVKLAASGLQRRLEFAKAREELGPNASATEVYELVKANHKQQ